MKVLILLLSIISAVCGYRILCLQNVPSRSHHNLMMGIVRPLLEAGHEVTMVTIFPSKKPVKNFKEIDVSYLEKITEGFNVMDSAQMSMTLLKEMVANLTKGVFSSPAVQETLMKENFDAVVTEWFFSDVESGYAAVLQAPWILLSAQEMSPTFEGMVDTVRSVPIIPVMMNDAQVPMNLWERIKNTVWYCLMTFGSIQNYPEFKQQYEELFSPIAKARGIELPPFYEAVRNISILLLNSHPSFTSAQSLPPNAVEIGGYHIDDNIPPLPKDLQDLLDSSKNGVIYFSMGSVMKSKMLPEKTRQDLIKLFGELPYTVLWKFEDQMDNLPKNLHIRPWMPQTSILTHPNVKVFITHGGALSTIESLRFGVPILAIPVFGDQPSNAGKSVRAGRALKITFSPDMAAELKVALNEMLSNESYYQRAQYLSNLFNKRPLSPRKLIQNYIELAIESKGAYHLRSKTNLYKWYEIWMLDQIAILLLVLYVVYRIIKKILCFIKNLFKGKKVKKH